MASSPSFADKPRIGSVSISTADSSYTSPTNIGVLLSGVNAGTKINEVVVKCAAQSASGLVRLFLHDGTTHWLFDEINIAPISGSATVPTTRVSTSYNNLVLPSGSWSARVTTSISQAIHVTALGADL